jgi:hypothetical protein
VRFTPLNDFELQSIYFAILNQFDNTTDGCSLYVVEDDGSGLPDWPSGVLAGVWVPPTLPDMIWIQVDLPSPISFSAGEDFQIFYGPAPAGAYPGTGWWNILDSNGSTTQRSYVSHDNRENWLVLGDTDAFVRAGGTYSSAVVINEVMFFPDTSGTTHERNHEWVELYNYGETADVGGWVISNRDASVDAVLPGWGFPSETYLVVHFTTGTDDNDFSDGEGDYYAGDADIFSETMDECALYTDAPSDTTIIDFMNWSETDAYTPGPAHDFAVSAGIWTDGDFFTPVDTSDIYAQIAWVIPGESMGRDSSSTDSDLSEDWETFGGADAIYASPGALNYQLLQIISPKDRGLEGRYAAWTVMFFLNGDSNLDRPYFRLLDDMERQGSLPNVNVVVQADFKNTMGGKTYRIFLEEDNVNATINSPSQDMGDLNSGAPQTLGEFIHWAQTTYPAGKYVLIIKNHGAGWKGVSIDETAGNDWIYMGELNSALYDYPMITGQEVLLFDACLMGMVEVARQVRYRVKTMVASEEINYVLDFPFNAIFATMNANTGWSAEQLAADMVAKATANVRRNDYTFSAIDCRNLGPLISQLDGFGFELEWGLDDYDFHYNVHYDPNDNVQIHVRNQLVQTEHFKDANFIDLYHFAQLIKADAAIPDDYKSQAQPIMNSLQKGGSIVIAEEHGGGHPNAHGLSIYFPSAQTKAVPPVPKANVPRGEKPYDNPWPSHLPDNSALAKYAFDPDDCNPPHDPCVNHFNDAKDHPYEATPEFFFVQDTWWDEFLHRYYEPVADAGGDQEAWVGEVVALSGVGSSDSDGDVKHWYWDFDASVDALPDCPPGEEDWDRDCADEANDDRNGGDAVQVDFPCVSAGTFNIMLTVWDDHNEQAGHNHNEHFETDQDPVVVKCRDTTFTFEPPADQAQFQNGSFESDLFVASDGTGNDVIGVTAIFTGTGVTNVTVIYTMAPPAPYVEGFVSYDVIDHCAPGGTVIMEATNDAEEQITGLFDIALFNTDPVIVCPPDEIFDYTDGYAGAASAFDEDNDPLAFSKVEGPDSLFVDIDGNITWETGPGDVGGPYQVTVLVYDLCDAMSACSFELMVTAPVGCCESVTGCQMMTEVECLEIPGSIWYPPPHECIDGVCRVVCGDCTRDVVIDVGDIVCTINYLFRGGLPPDPVCIADVNCDGIVNVADVVYVVSYLYREGPTPCLDCCGTKAGMERPGIQKIERDSPPGKVR